MKKMGGRDYQLWDEEDGFFYDVLRYPDGHYDKFRVRSLVGLIPLYAIERIEERWIKPFDEFYKNLTWFIQNRRDLCQNVAYLRNVGGRSACWCWPSWTRPRCAASWAAPSIRRSSSPTTACAASRGITPPTPSAWATRRCATSPPSPSRT